MISIPAHRPDNPEHDRWRYAQVKRDGIFLRVRKDRVGRVRAYTRHPTDVTEAVSGQSFFGWLVTRLDYVQEVWGELWVPGSPASEVKSVLAGRNDRALAYDAFACPGALGDWASLNEVNEHLRYVLHQSVPETYLRYLPTMPHSRGCVTGLPSLEDLPPDQEGWVLKQAHMTGWTKLKPEKTLDLVVTGLQAGRGKYLGQVGALHVAVVDDDGGLHEVARVSGMDDATRRTIDESWVGTVVEVAYQYVGSGGRLRHPRFKQRREDKKPTAEDCGWRQDSSLLNEGPVR